jgi:hypothetical protein
MSDVRGFGGFISGYCPMGCGETLELAVGGTVGCGHALCPCPDAVARILADPETEHIVDLQPDGYSIKHPLAERINDALLDCDLHDHVQRMIPDAALGRYRVARSGERWEWTMA